MTLSPYGKTGSKPGSNTRTKLGLALLAFLQTLVAQAQSAPGGFYDEITIVGSQEGASRITGSAYFIGADQLRTFAYSDIERIVREIPGVSVQLEDGYGLRPNISIRGVTTERSSRITLLEDNVLIAPAPYSAPAAYYFPTSGRMSAFEVVKGPSAITQGPYTIGGALNMVSTPIPNGTGGKLLLEGAEDATYRVHATYGGWTDAGLGYLLETHQWQSDGFQRIDRGGNDAGFDVRDYTAKLAYAPMSSRHALELKLQRTDQDSNQSYLGLTDADFAARPSRRYGVSVLDRIDTTHEQQVLRYEFRASDLLRFSATAYNNEHARNWYKTEGIDLDGAVDTAAMRNVNWLGIIEDINLGRGRAGFTPAQLAAILDGTSDTPANSIQLRNNNREYYSRGVQFGMDWQFATGRMQHSLEAGVRLHRDQEDRFQHDDAYQQLSGQLVFNGTGIAGAAGNEEGNAKALAVHVYDSISMGAWTFTPGLRHEDIELDRVRFTGPARTFRDRRVNDVQVWLPGLGVAYAVNGELSLLAGVHKGFTAPTNQPGIREEEALNYELGFRYGNERFNTEMIGFLSDYDNLLGLCTAASGANCNVGDAFNGDAVTIGGVEFQLAADLSRSARFSLPLQLGYTWMHGEFDTDIGGTAFFGNVSKGDPIPYIPDNQLRLSLGVAQQHWGMTLSANYVDAICVRASCKVWERTDDMLTLDLAANYQLNEQVNLYARVENLGAEDVIMSRHPYGARPNKPRTAAFGVRVSY
jgi:Fe(3+) dicitrate transport protein